MKTYIVSTAGLYGYWGRGDSLYSAAQNCKKHGGKNKDIVSMSVILNDPDAFIDDFGAICYGGVGKQNADCINVGYSTLAGLLKPKI
jgi:hypothetical protein